MDACLPFLVCEFLIGFVWTEVSPLRKAAQRHVLAPPLRGGLPPRSGRAPLQLELVTRPARTLSAQVRSGGRKRTLPESRYFLKRPDPLHSVGAPVRDAGGRAHWTPAEGADPRCSRRAHTVRTATV